MQLHVISLVCKTYVFERERTSERARERKNVVHCVRRAGGNESKRLSDYNEDEWVDELSPALGVVMTMMMMKK